MPKYTFKNGRFHKDGKPYFAIASDYHYFRDRRDNWEDRLTKLKALGVNVLTFYTPWRHHIQFKNGELWYDFTGETKDSRDLVTFLRIVERVGLLMIFKPGPFVHSELNVGGLPDLVTPTFNPGIAAMRRHDGSPVRWTYDNAILPAACDATYDQLVKEWMKAVSPHLAPYAKPDGPLIAIQLNDETIYCTSNDPPWRVGYEPSAMRFFHEQLAERYGDIAAYNTAHGTAFEAFHKVTAPGWRWGQGSGAGGTGREGAVQSFAYGAPTTTSSIPQSQIPNPKSASLSYVDWAEHQWRIRRDCYVRYKEYVDIDTTYLTNYAGVTPPIVQNVPDHVEDVADVVPAELGKTYSDWWFAMNRVDADAENGDCEYGMISWLGVAAYDEAVFDRYVNTARRRRGINMEENWGFAAFYDKRSKEPIVPVFQTLLSVAGGATGYDIYTGMSTDYWDDTLDRVTKKQCPTFPSDAPIDKDGNPGVLYNAAKLLNQWFNTHGDALVKCDPENEAAYLLYAPYAAVASWVPDEKHWDVNEHELPRCGHEAFEPWSTSLQRAGYSPVARELESATVEWMLGCKCVSIHAAYFMGEAEQKKLATFIEREGRLFISGELPSFDAIMKPCTIFKDAVESALKTKNASVTYRQENLFADGQFAKRLADAGVISRVRSAEIFRAFAHFGSGDASKEQFVFFFNLEEGAPHEKWIEIDDQRIELTLGSKTCGVLRITEGEFNGHFVKGHNEIDGVTADVRITMGEQVIDGRGDFVG